jgi:hypothetical protein
MERPYNLGMEKDINQIAAQIVSEATDVQTPTQAEISRIMAHIGRKGGLKGGKARALALSPEKRRKIAKKAAQSRWLKK